MSRRNSNPPNLLSKFLLCPFSGERISFSYLISEKYTSETAELGIMRNGKPLTVTTSLKVRPSCHWASLAASPSGDS